MFFHIVERRLVTCLPLINDNAVSKCVMGYFLHIKVLEAAQYSSQFNENKQVRRAKTGNFLFEY